MTSKLDRGDGSDYQSQAIGGAIAWLAFYAMAVVVVVVSNRAADIVVAAVN
jgi:hypothetical protein